MEIVSKAAPTVALERWRTVAAQYLTLRAIPTITRRNSYRILLSVGLVRDGKGTRRKKRNWRNGRCRLESPQHRTP